MTTSTLNEPKNGNGKAATVKTDLEITGQYLLAVVDDSNERWSRPEWVSWTITRVMCLTMLIGGFWLMTLPKLDADARMMATILTPAAGFKLIEGAAGAANKRGTSSGKKG